MFKFYLFNMKLMLKKNWVIILLLLTTFCVSVIGVTVFYGIAMTGYEYYDEDGSVLYRVKSSKENMGNWLQFLNKNEKFVSITENLFLDNMPGDGCVTINGKENKNYPINDLTQIKILYESPIKDDMSFQKKDKIVYVNEKNLEDIKRDDILLINGEEYIVAGHLKVNNLIDFAFPYYSPIIEIDSVYLKFSEVLSLSEKSNIFLNLNTKQLPSEAGQMTVMIIVAIGLGIISLLGISVLYKGMIKMSYPIISLYEILGSSKRECIITMVLSTFMFLVIGMILGGTISMLFAEKFIKSIFIRLNIIDHWIVVLLLAVGAIFSFMISMINIFKKNKINGASEL